MADLEKSTYDKVKEEGLELHKKLTLLGQFMETPEFEQLEPVHQELLNAQYAAMNTYFRIITLRLGMWNKTTDNKKSAEKKSNIIIPKTIV